MTAFEREVLRYLGNAAPDARLMELIASVEAEMRLEINGQVVETYPLTDLEEDFQVAQNPDDGRSELAIGATVTFFWTPQAHPWKADQSVIITARVVDSQGNVYERQMDLIS